MPDDPDIEQVLRSQADVWYERALQAQERAAPGDIIADFVRQLPSCPRCGLGGRSWRKRTCCKIGRALAQWEARRVADILMEKEPSAGGGPTQSGSLSIGFTGKTP